MRPFIQSASVFLTVLSALLVSAPAESAEAAALRQPPSSAEKEVLALEATLRGDPDPVEALAAVLRLRELVTEVSDLTRLREILLRPALSRKFHGEVRALARLTLAEIEWRRGRRPKAERWVRGLDPITRGLFIGPFDNTSGRGFETVYPPEEEVLAGKEPDFGTDYAGKDHPVRWRRLPPVSPLGRVDLRTLLSPADEVVVYVRTVVRARRATTATLRLGTPGPTRVWLNGERSSNPMRTIPRASTSTPPPSS